jgi:hypothetical protein
MKRVGARHAVPLHYATNPVYDSPYVCAKLQHAIATLGRLSMAEESQGRTAVRPCKANAGRE